LHHGSRTIAYGKSQQESTKELSIFLFNKISLELFRNSFRQGDLRSETWRFVASSQHFWNNYGWCPEEWKWV